MKSLSGANPESKPDYRQQALTELNKLESKVILLNEMLDNVDTTRNERFVAGDVYDVRSASSRVTLSDISDVLVTIVQQVGSLLSNARPKIQKWISDAESHDPESLGEWEIPIAELHIFPHHRHKTLTKPPRHIPPN